MDIVTLQEQGRVPVTVFQVKGRINLGNAEQLQTQAQEAFEAGTRNLLIDLTEVPSMTSAGLRAIIHIYHLLGGGPSRESGEAIRQAPASGSLKSPHLKLLNPAPHVRRVLQIAGFGMFVEIYENMQDAIASFG